jgi:dihydropteroate synthase
VGRRRERFKQILEGARAQRGVALMGVCNVTPDSFSDGGRYLSLEDAKRRVQELLAEGADFIDVGGESTRPGAPAVPPGEQLSRVLGVVAFAAELGACVSIDTASPVVASACLDAGACIVNDVSCLREEGLAGVCASHGAPLVLMHSREPMNELKGFSAYPDDAYGDVVKDVIAEWATAAARAMAQGLTEDALIMDPGLGFAKNARHSMELLAATAAIAGTVGVPVCIGASRKSFLSRALAPAVKAPCKYDKHDKHDKPAERIGASLAAALFAARHGAAILRVHDVRATRQAIDLERRLHATRRPGGQGERTEGKAR